MEQLKVSNAGCFSICTIYVYQIYARADVTLDLGQSNLEIPSNAMCHPGLGSVIIYPSYLLCKQHELVIKNW